MSKYLCRIDGGEGPDVWDREFTVDADSFMDAVKQAEAVAQEESAVVSYVGFSQ